MSTASSSFSCSVTIPLRKQCSINEELWWGVFFARNMVIYKELLCLLIKHEYVRTTSVTLEQMFFPLDSNKNEVLFFPCLNVSSLGNLSISLYLLGVSTSGL